LHGGGLLDVMRSVFLDFLSTEIMFRRQLLRQDKVGSHGNLACSADPPLDSRQESSDDGREQKHPVGLVQSCAEAEQKHSSPPLQTLIRSFRTSRMAYYQQRIILVRLVAHCMAVTAPGPEFEGVARGAGADDYGVVDGCRRRPMREDPLI